MNLSIEIDVLRGLNERCPKLSFDRDDLIDLAEYVAGEMARTRQTESVVKGYEFVDCSEQPEPTPVTVETQPETQISQPKQADPQSDAPPARQRMEALIDQQDGKLVQADRDEPVIAATEEEAPHTKSTGRATQQKPRDTRSGKCGAGRPWTDAEDMMLVRLKHSGMTWGAIGSELDRTSGSAEQRYIKLKKQGAVNVQKDPTPEPNADTPAPSPVGGPNSSASEIEPKPIATALETVSDTARVSDFGDMSILKTRQRALVVHLANLSDDFAPIDDLDIVEGLLVGKKPTAIADELGCRSDDITKRWRAMLTADVVNRFGTPTIDGQQDVLTAARHLVKCAEARHG